LITNNFINHCYNIDFADIPSCIHTTAIPATAADAHSKWHLWIHSGSRYNYCDCSNYCLVNNHLTAGIAAIDYSIHPS
jgi:hypothetical protein